MTHEDAIAKLSDLIAELAESVEDGRKWIKERQTAPTAGGEITGLEKVIEIDLDESAGKIIPQKLHVRFDEAGRFISAGITGKTRPDPATTLTEGEWAFEDADWHIFERSTGRNIVDLGVVETYVLAKAIADAVVREHNEALRARAHVQPAAPMPAEATEEMRSAMLDAWLETPNPNVGPLSASEYCDVLLNAALAAAPGAKEADYVKG